MDEFTPITDEAAFDLYFGPVHPGSGNFGVKLAVDGERVIGARADPGYLHRGFEKLMEYRIPLQNAVLSDRFCIFDSLNWNLVHAEAMDELMGLEIPPRAQHIRVIFSELSRITSHIGWYAFLSHAVGFDTGFKIGLGYRDYILDIFALVTGGRVYPAGYICPGGVRRDLPPGAEKAITLVLDKIDEMLTLEEMEAPFLRERLEGVGVLPLDAALRMGATGQVLRGSGMASDVRKEDPYEIYDELDFDIPSFPDGDAYARFRVGLAEIAESVKIIRQTLARLPDGDYVHPKFKRPNLRLELPHGEAYVRIEGARGESAMYIVGNGGTSPYRAKIRGPSFLHMIPVLEYLLTGASVADIPAIFWSLNVGPADMDR